MEDNPSPGPTAGDRRIEHEDFVVQIGPGWEGQLAVRVVASPAGEGGAPFQLPWTGMEWLRLRAGLRRAARHLAFNDADEAAQIPAPREVGAALFQALFAGQVGQLLASSLGMVGDRGLRLRLRFQLDLEDPRLPLLHSLPWELLYQPDTRDFLALSRRTPVVRSLEIPRPAAPLALPSPLRILVVPGFADSLDLEEEQRQIRNAWKDLPGVEVVCLKAAETTALRQALLGAPFHILHFLGHGELDPATGQGVLFLAGPDGGPVPLSGEALATLLKDFRALRIVFLNACETGRMPDGAEQDPYAGLAAALVLGGLPAVLAMQLPIADEAAIVFSRTIYRRLAAGDPIEAAVTEGRQALYVASPDSAEWAIPVLFSRIPDGRIFVPSAEISPVPGPQARPDSPWPRRQIIWAAALVLLAVVAIFAVRTIAPFVAFPGRPDLPLIATVEVGGFRIAKYEVTNREYLQFVHDNPQWRRDRILQELHDGDYLEEWISPTEYPPGLDDHPVAQVSWYAARAFCRWMGGELPTQEQWQTAAHAATRRFPWGKLDLSGPPQLNFCDAECDRQHRDGTFRPGFRDGYPRTAPVNEFPGGRTPEGVYNLSGNVWEWCLNPSQSERVTMGGSYLAAHDECTTDLPVWEKATLCGIDGGFRCVWK